MKRRERIIEIAAKLATARGVVARLEQELDVFIGDEAEPAPTRKGKAAKVEEAEAATPPAAPPPPEPQAIVLGILAGARRGRPRAVTSARNEEILALRKQGMEARDIAAKLRVTVPVVGMCLWRARKKGLLPKGFAPNGATP